MKFRLFRVPVLIFISVMIFTACEMPDEEKTTSAWTQLGSSFESMIYDVISDNNGNIYSSGGDIWQISAWNGTSWNRLGNIAESPFTGGVYWPITSDLNGNIYAVGRIAVPMAGSEYHVAKWEKSSNAWINLTSSGPLFDNGIYSMCTDMDGNLYVSGNVNHITEQGSYIYQWNGSMWKNLGNRLMSGANIALHIDAEGQLYASFGINENFSAYVAKWNGTAWEELGGKNSANFGTGSISCLGSDSQGNLYTGGYFTDGITSHNINKWTRSTNTWSSFYTFYSTADVYSMCFDTADTLYVAGRFTNEKNQHYVAKYHGELWSDYGELAANNTIQSICFDKNGVMYAGGEFTNGSNKYFVTSYKRK